MIGQHEILLVCALASRCFGMVVCLPFGEAMNVVPRLCLAALWGVSLLGSVSPVGSLSAAGCLWEFASGVLIGAPLRLVPDAAEMLGELIDTARGQTISSVNDPLGSQTPSDLAAISRTAVVALAVYVGALEVVLQELRGSYELFPLGAPWQGAVHAESLFQWCVATVGGSFGLASVWLASFLMVDLVAGIAARLVRGLQLSLAPCLVKLMLTCIFFGGLVASVREVPLVSIKAWLCSWHPSIESSALGRGRTQAGG